MSVNSNLYNEKLLELKLLILHHIKGLNFQDIDEINFINNIEKKRDLEKFHHLETLINCYITNDKMIYAINSLSYQIKILEKYKDSSGLKEIELTKKEIDKLIENENKLLKKIKKFLK